VAETSIFLFLTKDEHKVEHRTNF